MAFSKTLTLDQEFIDTFPMLKVQTVGESSTINFRLKCVINGDMAFTNSQDSTDDFFINVNRFKERIDNLIVKNFEEFYRRLKDCSIEQEIKNYHENH